MLLKAAHRCKRLKNYATVVNARDCVGKCLQRAISKHAFISYSQSDPIDQAGKLYELLATKAGFKRTWYDQMCEGSINGRRNDVWCDSIEMFPNVPFQNRYLFENFVLKNFVKQLVYRQTYFICS
jgi:hypothetical protein